MNDYLALGNLGCRRALLAHQSCAERVQAHKVQAQEISKGEVC